MEQRESDRRRPWLGKVIRAGVVLVAVVAIGLVMRGGGPAQIPPAFDPGVTLTQATAAAKAAGQPVLVFATADWCGPCQTLKRGGLADQRVNAWIEANTKAVYLDVDKSRDEAIELGVTSIPALIVMRNDKIIDRLDGVHDADALLEWLTHAK